jgi:hypothetical protein
MTEDNDKRPAGIRNGIWDTYSNGSGKIIGEKVEVIINITKERVAIFPRD